MQKNSDTDVLEFIANLLYVAFLICALIFTSSVLYETGSASGEVDYCYLTNSTFYETKIVHLRGHRSWRPDITIDNFKSTQEALDIAAKINCRIGVKK
jgi:hypothetical protein